MRNLIQLFTEGAEKVPRLDNCDCWYKLSCAFVPQLYPKPKLLSVRQNKQVTDSGNGGLAVEHGLGSLRRSVSLVQHRNRERGVARSLTAWSFSAVTESMALATLAKS